MEQVRPLLEAFAADMLGGLARADQRAKGERYLRGLLLRQFVTSSTWDHVEVRKQLARWADEFIRPAVLVRA
jgi:hypothetical protein